MSRRRLERHPRPVCSNERLRRVCSQAPVNEQPLEFAQHRNHDARLAQGHSRTRDAIQHPRRHHPHYAWDGLDVHYATAASFLDVSYLDATPVQGMPTVMDFNYAESPLERLCGCLSRDSSSDLQVIDKADILDSDRQISHQKDDYPELLPVRHQRP